MYKANDTTKVELYKQNIQLKMGLGPENKRKYETINDRIIFNRFLGHIEIQNGHEWKMDTRCWICEKWKYT